MKHICDMFTLALEQHSFSARPQQEQVARWRWLLVSLFEAERGREGEEPGGGGAGCERVGPSSGFHYWIISLSVAQAAQHGAARFTASKIASS